MKPLRIVALLIGCLMAFPALAFLASGATLGLASLAQRDDGYFDVTLDRVRSSTPAVTAERIDLRTEPGTPRWVLDALDTDVRLRVTPAEAGQSVFVGIALENDLDQYLRGVAHDEVIDVQDLKAVFQPRAGDGSVASPPSEQNFWEVQASGPDTQEIEWEARSGNWAVAVMNADGSSDVAVDLNVGVRSAAVGYATIGLLVAGVLLTMAAVALVLIGGTAVGSRDVAAPDPSPRYPVTLQAQLDPGLSRWMWLVKWLLAIPHVLILSLLWLAYVLLTIVAGVAILFTGRYPRSIFDFNVGVLRWGWRVSYYAASGGLGTDRYPPFSLQAEPDYPATLEIDYPERLSRGLVMVKWWLLAIPHYIILAVLVSGGFRWTGDSGWAVEWGPTGSGLVAILALVAAVSLLITGRYPQALFDLIIGINRWLYRVIAYAGLMTDRYPPFRLDQGGSEPPAVPTATPPPTSGGTTAVERKPAASAASAR